MTFSCLFSFVVTFAFAAVVVIQIHIFDFFFLCDRVHAHTHLIAAAIGSHRARNHTAHSNLCLIPQPCRPNARPKSCKIPKPSALWRVNGTATGNEPNTGIDMWTWERCRKFSLKWIQCFHRRINENDVHRIHITNTQTFICCQMDSVMWMELSRKDRGEAIQVREKVKRKVQAMPAEVTNRQQQQQQNKY